MPASLATVALLVADYDAAIAFFCGSLGFTLRSDTDLGGGKRWVVVAPAGGGASLLLARATTRGRELAVRLALELGQLQQAEELLASHYGDLPEQAAAAPESDLARLRYLIAAAQAVERNPAQGVQVVLRLQTNFGAVAPVRHRIGRRPLQLVQLRDSSRQVAPFQTPLRPCQRRQSMLRPCPSFLHRFLPNSREAALRSVMFLQLQSRVVS